MSPRGKLPYEFKPGEALTAAGLNNIQSQILDEVDANRSAAEQTGVQLDQKIADVAKKAAADLTDAMTKTGQRIDAVQSSLDGKITTTGAALDKKFTDQGANLDKKITDTGNSLTTKITTEKDRVDKAVTWIDAADKRIGGLQEQVKVLNDAAPQYQRVTPELTRLLRMMSPVAASRVMEQRDGSKALSQEFTTSGGTVILFVSGAARRDGETMGLSILVDGKQVDRYLAFDNEKNSHKTFVQLPTVITGLAAGKHTVLLQPVSPTSVDLNDFFDVAVLELPPLSPPPARFATGGKFPHETTVETQGGLILAFFHGSGFRNPGGGLLGMDLVVDDQVYGASRGFTNEQGSHKAFVPAAVVIPNLPAGQHKVRLNPHAGMLSDSNDYAAFLFVEFPPLVQARALSLLKQQPGGLPLKAPFTTRGGPVMLIVNGAGWHGQAEKQIGMDISIDGTKRGACRRYTNEASSHKAFVSAFLVLTLPAGNHTLQLDPWNGTSSDQNDFFDVALLELPN